MINRIHVLNRFSHFFTAHGEEIGKLRELRPKEVASEQHLIVGQPKHHVVCTLGTGCRVDLETTTTQGKGVGDVVVDTNIRNQTSKVHAGQGAWRLGDPRKQCAIALMQVGIELREVPLFFFKFLMSDELGLVSRPKPRAAHMVCMTVTQHDFDGLKITQDGF